MQNLTTEETCSVSDLKPYRNYTFTVTVRSGSGDSNYLRRSIPLSASFRTQEGLPGMVNCWLIHFKLALVILFGLTLIIGDFSDP